jgi:hypothetical protein
MKKVLLWVFVLWALGEVAYQVRLSRQYHLKGHFNWSYYAFHRNRADIEGLFTAASHLLTERTFVEVRRGVLVDSVGLLPASLRARVLRLAHDIEPTGTFYVDFQPVVTGSNTLVVTGPCPMSNACQCIDWLRPSLAQGFMLSLTSYALPYRRHSPTEFDYVRVDNAALGATLAKSACYERVSTHEFVTTKGLPPGLPVPYNARWTDLLLTKVGRAMGIL